MLTYVDAAYAVHTDRRSHTGGAVTFGTGAVLAKSSKQKLNTKSSTEAELVGSSDYLPHAIWAKKFLEHQGYDIVDNVFYQDNESAIRFQKNGRKSCGPNSKHIDIRYFFIKDRLELDSFRVQHCPMDQMIADFFTKPLQGNLFRKLRAIIMGHAHVSTLLQKTETRASDPAQECVGRSVNVTDGNVTDRNMTDGKVVGIVAKDLAKDLTKSENVTSIRKNVTKDGSGSKASQPPTYADMVRRVKKVTFESERKPLLPLTFKR